MAQLTYLENVVTLELDINKCIGCGMCTVVCPHGVFAVNDKAAEIMNRDSCIECGACSGNCPVDALSVKAGVGCASAIINGWIKGEEPNCDCGGSC